VNAAKTLGFCLFGGEIIWEVDLLIDMGKNCSLGSASTRGGRDGLVGFAIDSADTPSLPGLEFHSQCRISESRFRFTKRQGKFMKRHHMTFGNLDHHKYRVNITSSLTHGVNSDYIHMFAAQWIWTKCPVIQRLHLCNIHFVCQTPAGLSGTVSAISFNSER
jgi:hypothetical protein